LSAPSSEITIGLARPEDVECLPDIELRAATLFSPEDLAPEHASESTPLSDYVAAQASGLLLVARGVHDRVVGFAHLEWIDEVAHLEELDVEPEMGRRGIGRRLVEAACELARSEGSDRITLSTFRDVPWNAPFYERLGFSAIPDDDLGPGLRARRDREAADGLDPAKRVMMSRRLPVSDSA